jgi:hypothetical protein
MANAFALPVAIFVLLPSQRGKVKAWHFCAEAPDGGISFQESAFSFNEQPSPRRCGATPLPLR